MTKTAKLKFNLLVSSSVGSVTFFSLPQINSYQEISSLSYPKTIFSKLDEEFYKNKVLALKGVNSQQIDFDVVLKDQNVELLSKKLKYSSLQNKYIRSDKFVNGKDPLVKKIAKEIKGETYDVIIKNSYDYVLEFLDYGYPFDGLYSFSQAIRDRVTDCGGFSTLLCSILNAKGVPTRIVVGFLLKNNKSTAFFSKLPIKSLSFNNLSMHAWVEALLPSGVWFPLDPSIEWRRKNGDSNRLGGFGYIPNDRLVVSFGQDLDLKYENKKYNIALLQYPISIKI